MLWRPRAEGQPGRPVSVGTGERQGGRGVPPGATKGQVDRGTTGLTKEHMRTTDDSGMQTAQVIEIVTTVHHRAIASN